VAAAAQVLVAYLLYHLVHAHAQRVQRVGRAEGVLVQHGDLQPVAAVDAAEAELLLPRRRALKPWSSS
jgi:hypothetical protein